MNSEEPYVLTDDEILDAVRTEVDALIHNAEGGGSFRTHMHVLINRTEHESSGATIFFGWQNSHEKRRQMRESGRQVSRTAGEIPLMAMLVSDTWVVERNMDEVTDEMLNDLEKRGPSAQPDRSSAFLVQALTGDGRTCSALLPYDEPNGEDQPKVFIRDDLNIDKQVKKLDLPNEIEEVGLLSEFFLGALEGKREWRKLE